MKVLVFTGMFIISIFGIADMPKWFTKCFHDKKLNELYSLVNSGKFPFLTADFNGDGIDDIAVKSIT